MNITFKLCVERDDNLCDFVVMLLKQLLPLTNNNWLNERKRFSFICSQTAYDFFVLSEIRIYCSITT